MADDLADDLMADDPIAHECMDDDWLAEGKTADDPDVEPIADGR